MLLRTCHLFSPFLQLNLQTSLSHLWLGRSVTTVSRWAGWMKRTHLELDPLNTGPTSLWSRWTPKHTHSAPYTCQCPLSLSLIDYLFKYLNYYNIFKLSFQQHSPVLVFYHRGYSTRHVVEGLKSSTYYSFRLMVTRPSGECSFSPAVSVFTNRERFLPI